LTPALDIACQRFAFAQDPSRAAEPSWGARVPEAIAAKR
jgi:hypothetical protein